MANTLKHRFVNPKVDGADATVTRPSDWNREHDFSGGSDGQLLKRDSVASDGASWTGTPSLTSLTLSTPLGVASGGLGVATLAAHGVLIGNGTGAVAVTGAGTAGQVLTSNGAAADPTFQASAGGTTLPVVDTQTIVKGSADATKLLRFEVDGFTTGVTRVLTPQNADYTIAAVGLDNAFSANQTIALASASLLVNATSGAPSLNLGRSGTYNGLIGVSHQTDGLVTGSATGDTVHRSTSGQNILFSIDGGSTIAAKITTGNRLAIPAGTTANDNSLNMLRVVGTMPTSPTAAVDAVRLSITSAGSAAQSFHALYAEMLAGYTGSSTTRAAQFYNAAVGTGATLNLGSDSSPIANISTHMLADGAGAGIVIGSYAQARNSTKYNIAQLGRAGSAVAGSNFGGLFGASGSTEATDPKNIGMWATLASSIPALNISAAIVGDNGSGTDPIAVFLDNGTEVMRIDDGGVLKIGGTTVIDASRNFTTVDLTSSGSLFQTGTTTQSGTTYTVAAGIRYVRCNNGAGLTVTLPAATGTGRVIDFKNINATNATISRAGSDTIDGATTLTVAQYAEYSLIDAASGVWDVR